MVLSTVVCTDDEHCFLIDKCINSCFMFNLVFIASLQGNIISLSCLSYKRHSL